MKQHVLDRHKFELLDIPKGLVFMLAGGIVVVLLGYTWLRRQYLFWRL